MKTIELPQPFPLEKPSLGCWLRLPTSISAEIAARIDFDYICIDMQHGYATRNDLPAILQALQPYARRVIVRVLSNEPSLIGWVLDMGATGVIVPLINSASEARSAVEACQYPPNGTRSMGPTRALAVFGDQYVQEARTCIQCIPMIETTTALNDLENILATPGVDVIYVGPSDLSVSLGLPRGNNDGEPLFDKALETIVNACSHHKVVPGIQTNADLATRRIKQGFRVLTVSEDDIAMSRGLNEDLKKLRS